MRHITHLACLSSFALLSACAHGLSAGAPLNANGIRVTVKKAELSGDTVRAELIFDNDLDRKIFVDRSQIAIVPPNGQSYYHTGKSKQGVVAIKPGSNKKVALEATVSGAGFGEEPGVYLRFDGVWLGSRRIDLPPLALGNAPASAGERADAKPPEDALEEQRENRRPSKGLFTKAKEMVFGADGVEEYDGPRKSISKNGTKSAVLPLSLSQVPDDIRTVLDDYLLTDLSDAGFDALGPDDINAIIGLDKLKQTLGSEEDTDFAAVGKALGVPYLVAGKVAATGNTMIVTLKLLDVENKRAIARVNKDGEGGKKIVPRLIGEAVQELVAGSGL